MNSAVNSWKSSLYFGKKKLALGKLVVRAAPLSWLVRGRLGNSVNAVERLQLLLGKRATDLEVLQTVFRYSWACGTLSRIRKENSCAWGCKNRFQKQAYVILNRDKRFSERRVCDVVQRQTALGQEKDRYNKWLQSESRPIASSFGSVRARLNHALCSLQRRLWKLNHCIVMV